MKKSDRLRACAVIMMWVSGCSGAPQEAAPPVEAPAPAVEKPAEPVVEATPTAAPTPTPTPEPAAPAEAPAAAETAKPAEAPKPTAAAPTPTPTPEPAAPVAKEAAAPTQPVAAAPAVVPCGKEGQPVCPLEEFMEHEVDIPMEKGDLAKVAAALTRTAAWAPDPSWNTGAAGWATVAKAGAAAANSGDEAALGQSCKTCHKTWRKKYKDSYRSLPLR